MTTVDLLDRCNDGQREPLASSPQTPALASTCVATETTLMLLDNRRQPVGSLVVQLQEEADLASRGVAEPGTSARVGEQILPAQHPFSEPHRPPVQSPEQDVGLDIVELLDQVVGQIRIMTDGADETTKLRPYANIAWQVMSSAHEAVLGNTVRADALRNLVTSMFSLYSIVETGGVKNTIRNLEDVLIRIVVQTTECGIFIQQYISNQASQTISETKRIVAELDNALRLLKAELGPKKTSPTSFVSAQTSPDVNSQDEIATLEAKLKPANMNADCRETCLPETRVHILQDLFTSLIDPNPSHKVTWLRGLAGSGKSTILNTVAQYSSKLRRRGAFLFWDRNDTVNSDPRRVVRTLAYQLARSNPVFAKELASQITSSPDILESSLDEQFQCLLQEPLSTLAARFNLGPIFVILDALDECGTTETRKQLIGALSIRLARLPSNFRVLIASRDEPDIRISISRLPVKIMDVRIDDESTKCDILRLFQRHLVSDAPAFADYGLPSEWPGGGVTRRLVDLSQGLFIWASTTIRFIESGFPQERLRKVLDASAHDEPHHRLDNLYLVALAHPFQSSSQPELDAVRSILGAIIVACEPLTDEELSQLLGLELGTIQGILSRLQPLLRWRRGGHAQPLHASFTDFLGDSERCRNLRWYINTSIHHHNLASCCLQLMQRKLRFNICGIETSHRRNHEIKDIEKRIAKAITHALEYASRYWADHLESGSSFKPGSHLVEEVVDFMKDRLLYWIEVFSLKNEMSTISIILQKASHWAQQQNNHTLDGLISEATKFVNAFGYPMGQSVPHIYLSALPFMSSESMALQRMHDIIPNTLSVQAGRSEPTATYQILMGRSQRVMSVAFSPDGTRIASASKDFTVRMWDAVSGRQIGGPLQGHSDWVRSVSFSPDGTQVVSGSDDATIRIWDAMSGDPIGEALHGHSSYVYSVAFSPDSTRIISGSCDKTIRIWDAASGASIGAPLLGHSGSVNSVAFSPDGTRIISASEDTTIQIWDGMSGTPISAPLRQHSESVRSVAFSPSGTLLASGSDDCTVQIWDAVSGTPFGRPLQGHSDPVISVAFSSDGTNIISGSCDGTVRIWDARSAMPIGTRLQSLSSITSVAISPNGTRIASSHCCDAVRIWHTTSHKSISETLQQNSAAVLSVAFSPDGTLITSGSADTTVQVWDAASDMPVGMALQGHLGEVNSVSFSPDGTHIVSGSDDYTIRIWDAKSGALIGEPLQGHSHFVASVAYSPDGTRIVSGSRDKTIRRWDAVSSAAIGEPLQGHSDWVTSVAYSHDGARIVSGSVDMTIRIWDALSGTPIGKPLCGHSNVVRSVSFSPDDTRIVSGSYDDTIRIWDAVSCTLVGKALGHSDGVLSVAYSRDGARIVSGSRDRTIRIWDAVLGAPVGDPLQGHAEHVNSVAFSPDGMRIVSASEDQTIRVWDASPASVTTMSQPRDSSLASANDSRFSAPYFLNGSSISQDGWITTADGHILFWVPAEYRSRLSWPRTLRILRASMVELNFDRFVHGPQWMQCHTGSH